jgi:hypothetical protein
VHTASTSLLRIIAIMVRCGRVVGRRWNFYRICNHFCERSSWLVGSSMLIPNVCIPPPTKQLTLFRITSASAKAPPWRLVFRSFIQKHAVWKRKACRVREHTVARFLTRSLSPHHLAPCPCGLTPRQFVYFEADTYVGNGPPMEASFG